MNRFAWLAMVVTLFAASAFSADPAAPSVGGVFDQQLKTMESELVPLAEAMPADKYGFAPTAGEFKNVRTFGQQLSHVAAVLYMVSSSVLGEKNPSDPGTGENGPATLSGKAAIVKYLKDAIAYGHKAMNSLTAANMTELVPAPFGNSKMARGSLASLAVWHSFDHYGQMVVYLRMNGIVPPASRPASR